MKSIFLLKNFQVKRNQTRTNLLMAFVALESQFGRDKLVHHYSSVQSRDTEAIQATYEN